MIVRNVDFWLIGGDDVERGVKMSVGKMCSGGGDPVKFWGG